MLKEATPLEKEVKDETSPVTTLTSVAPVGEDGMQQFMSLLEEAKRDFLETLTLGTGHMAYQAQLSIPEGPATRVTLST